MAENEVNLRSESMCDRECKEKMLKNEGARFFFFFFFYNSLHFSKFGYMLMF